MFVIKAGLYFNESPGSVPYWPPGGRRLPPTHDGGLGLVEELPPCCVLEQAVVAVVDGAQVLGNRVGAWATQRKRRRRRRRRNVRAGERGARETEA